MNAIIKFLNNNYWKDKKDGYFIDIGASDGINLSNSQYLERLGWNGICIEPIPEVFNILKLHRKCDLLNLAITEEEKIYKFLYVKGRRDNNYQMDMLSGIEEYYTEKRMERINTEIQRHGGEKIYIDVQGKRFNDIITETNIDFVSIDVEGAELPIIKSIDFDKYNIFAFAIENNPNANQNIEHNQELIDIMILNGYELVHTHSADNIFVKNN